MSIEWLLRKLVVKITQWPHLTCNIMCLDTTVELGLVVKWLLECPVTAISEVWLKLATLFCKYKSNKQAYAFVLSVFMSEFDLRSFLCSESEQLIWKSQGLPSDDLSMENALVILQVRHPFACLSNLVDLSTFVCIPLITNLLWHRRIYVIKAI